MSIYYNGQVPSFIISLINKNTYGNAVILTKLLILIYCLISSFV